MNCLFFALFLPKTYLCTQTSVPFIDESGPDVNPARLYNALYQIIQ